MGEVRRDIYGNAIEWRPTGRRVVFGEGRMRAEMQRDGTRSWMYCRPHEECSACAELDDHDDCPRTAESNTEGQLAGKTKE